MRKQKTPVFFTKANRLTRYGLACGYIEKVSNMLIANMTVAEIAEKLGTLKHDPHHPAYESLCRQVIDQYRSILALGYRVEFRESQLCYHRASGGYVPVQKCLDYELDLADYYRI